MKILFYNHTGKVSGAEHMLLMILKRLDRSVFNSLVLCPPEESLAEMVSDLGIPVEPIASLQARFTWRLDLLVGYLKSFCSVMVRFRRKAKQINPDLIHANSIRAGLVATAATVGFRTRVIWHLHDMLPAHPLSVAIRLMALLSRRTRMLAVSQAVADNFAGSSGSLKSRMSVILNGIELTRFRLIRSASQQIRQELGLAADERVIGIVGQLTPRKGQLELLSAFAEVLRHIPGSTLVIVGAALFNRDNEYADLLKKTVLRLGISDKVRLCGSRSDIPEIIQAMDLLIVNSKVEPFGLVALESMACGVPVLSTASGGTAELINHDRNGWLVPVGDQDALSAAIIELLGDPSRLARLGAQGKLDVKQRFSAERYLAEIMALYLRNGDSISGDVQVHESEAPTFVSL